MSAYGYSVDDNRALDTIRAVFESPVRFLDTSRNYGDGRSESLIGQIIREKGGLPEGFVLSSKLDRDPQTSKLGAVEARRSLEHSLKALGLSKIHILHLHDPEYCYDINDITKTGGALDELMKMRDEGLCDAVGLAAGRISIMLPLLRDWDFDAVITHNRYTLANRNAEPLIDCARARNVSVINAAPFASGILAKGTAVTRRYVYQDASDEVLATIRQLERLAQKYHIDLRAAAFHFSLSDSRITSTLCGITRPERVDETLSLLQTKIPQDFWDEYKTLKFNTEDPEINRIKPR